MYFAEKMVVAFYHQPHSYKLVVVDKEIVNSGKELQLIFGLSGMKTFFVVLVFD